MAFTRQRALEVGDRFKLHPDCGVEGEFEVVKVSGESSATVRSLTRTTREIRDAEGEVVAVFAAPGRRFTIARRSSVVLTHAA